MKSRTSFFNFTVLKKDITRFAPLWGLYTVFVLLFLLAVWGSGDTGSYLIRDLPYMLSGMAPLNLFYAGMAALLLFGDLFKTRLCNALHALPIRREGWFVTHVTSGLLFCLVPNVLAAAIGALLLGEFAYGAAIWLAVTVLEYVVFFGIGVFSVICAGNGLGAVAIYAILNFLATILAFLLMIFYDSLLYGISMEFEAVSNFSPVILLAQCEFFEMETRMNGSIVEFSCMLWEQWLMLGIATVLGVVLIALSLLIYRKRNLEAAGDFVSFPPAGPVFLGLYTLCVAAVLFFITEELTGPLGYVFLVIGMGIGFFTGRMLLEKKVHVFRGKNFLAWGILTGGLLLSMLLTFLDPVGITRYVPQADQVRSIRVSPYSSRYSINSQSIVLTDGQDLEEIIALHEQAVRNRPGEFERTRSICIRYTMKNGATLQREYHMPEDRMDLNTMRRIYSRPECVFEGNDPQELLSKLNLVELHPYEEDKLPFVVVSYPGEEWMYTEKFGENSTILSYPCQGDFSENEVAAGLIAALLKDCEAGHMSQWENGSNPVASLTLEYTQRSGIHGGLYLTIYEDCENTLNFIKNLK